MQGLPRVISQPYVTSFCIPSSINNMSERGIVVSVCLPNVAMKKFGVELNNMLARDYKNEFLQKHKLFSYQTIESMWFTRPLRNNLLWVFYHTHKHFYKKKKNLIRGVCATTPGGGLNASKRRARTLFTWGLNLLPNMKILTIYSLLLIFIVRIYFRLFHK